MLRPHNLNAETLIESIIAVSILMTVLVPVSGVHVSAMRVTAANPRHVIALGLAEEGLEAIRNIRDTNLLRFSPKAEECWNTKPDAAITLDDCAVTTNKIGTENSDLRMFRLMRDPETLQWSLDSGVPLLPMPDIERYRLRHDTTATGLYFLPSANMDPLRPRGEPSIFYRQIVIQYFNQDADPATFEGMKVTSVVHYSVGGSRPKVRLSTIFMKPL